MQREQSAPLLWSPCENGLVLVLREALDVPLADVPVDRAGERGTARGTSAIVPAKLQRTTLAGLVAVLELILCWCESTVAFAAAGGALLWVAGKTGPRLGECSLERHLLEVAACALYRDWKVAAARFFRKDPEASHQPRSTKECQPPGLSQDIRKKKLQVSLRMSYG